MIRMILNDKKYLKQILSNRKMLSAFFAIFGIAITYCIGNIYYNEPDDYLMNYISQGKSSNGPDSHLIFINVIIGKLLKFLYNITLSVNWFGILYLSTIIIIFATLMYIYWELLNTAWGPLTIGIIEIVVLCNLTFTIIAYLCMGTAFIYWMYSAKKQKYKILDIVVVILFFGLGLMYRRESLISSVFISAMVILLPLLIYNIQIFKKKINFFILFLCLITLVAVGKYDEYQYRDSLWENFSSYNIARSGVVDYPSIDYMENKDALQKMNLSENDINCIENWIFADKKVFSEENLKEIYKINPVSQKYNLKPFNILGQMFKLKYNYVFLLFLLICFMLVGKRERIFISCSGILTYMMIAALIFRNRLVGRVMIPIYIIGGMVILFFLCYNQKKDKRVVEKGLIVILCIMTCISVKSLHNHYQKARVRENNNSKYMELCKYINKHDDLLYTSVSTTINEITIYRPIFNIDECIHQKNLVSLGTWDIYSSRYYYKVDKYHNLDRDNLILSLTESDNMQYITKRRDERTKLLIKYIEEHTGGKVISTKIKEFPDADIEIYDLKLKESAND